MAHQPHKNNSPCQTDSSPSSSPDTPDVHGRMDVNLVGWKGERLWLVSTLWDCHIGFHSLLFVGSCLSWSFSIIFHLVWMQLENCLHRVCAIFDAAGQFAGPKSLAIARIDKFKVSRGGGAWALFTAGFSQRALSSLSSLHSAWYSSWPISHYFDAMGSDGPRCWFLIESPSFCP